MGLFGAVTKEWKEGGRRSTTDGILEYSKGILVVVNEGEGNVMPEELHTYYIYRGGVELRWE